MHFNLYILTLLSVSSGIFAHPISVPETLQRRGTTRTCSWQGDAARVAACVAKNDQYSKSCSWANTKCSTIRLPDNHECRKVQCLQGDPVMNKGEKINTDSSGKPINILNPLTTGTRMTAAKAGPPKTGASKAGPLQAGSKRKA
ncbi:hypothetical protein C8J56DRAFT_900023 [Mycena floridula]|nr:hypothetical protein C8J56DRAFT_900023 [Mycena floridula]